MDPDVVREGPPFVRSQAKKNRGFKSGEVPVQFDMAGRGTGIIMGDTGEPCQPFG